MINVFEKILFKFHKQIVDFPYGEYKEEIDLLKKHNVTTVFDVGANKGQFARLIQWAGFNGKIYSFEPTTEAYSLLKKNAGNNAQWKTYKLAVGNFSEEVEINIAGNSFSSSILKMLQSHIDSAPNSKYIGKERVAMIKLDDFILQNQLNENIYLKIDTQGYEKLVFEGALKSLHLIKGIRMELSLKPLYENETLFDQMVKYLNSFEYKLMYVAPTFRDQRTGELLQIDAFFFKK